MSGKRWAMEYKGRYKPVVLCSFFALVIFVLYGGCLLVFGGVMGEDARDEVAFEPDVNYPLLGRFLAQEGRLRLQLLRSSCSLFRLRPTALWNAAAKVFLSV